MNKRKKAFRAGFKGKKIILRNAIECKTYFSKARGLMFRNADFKTPLLFIWEKKGSYSIHSFFCRKFLAVWLLKSRVVDVKIVKPWICFIKPKSEFDCLIEIPFKSESEILQFLVGS